VWCGTHRGGVFRSDDDGRSWTSVGLSGRLITAITASPVERDACGWVPSRAKCGAQGMLVRRGHGPAD
jgi:hypothetical protein